MADAYVIDAIRTPFGRYGGALAKTRPDDLAAHVVTATSSAMPGLEPERIDDVIFGNANGAGEDNRNVARMAVLLAGLPTSIPGVTVNRLCASSLEAAIQASRAIETGDAEHRAHRRRRVDEPRAVGGDEARARFRARVADDCTRRRSAGAWSTRGCTSAGRSASVRAQSCWRPAFEIPRERQDRVRARQPPQRREGLGRFGFL